MGLFKSIGKFFSKALKVLTFGASNYLWKKFKEWMTPDMPDKEALKVQRQGSDHSIPVVYGERIVGAIIVDKNVQDLSGGIENDLLHMFAVFCHGEIDSFVEFFFNGISWNDKRWRKDPENQFSAKWFTVEVKLGSPTQTAMNGVNKFNRFSAATSKYEGLACAIFTFQQNEDGNIWNSEPEITARIRGKKCFDPRTGLTEYTENPAIHLLDYFKSPIYGKALPDSLIDIPSFINVANVADATNTATVDTQICQTVDGVYTCTGSPAETVTFKRFTHNNIIDTGAEIFNNIKEISNSFRGYFPESTGLIQIACEKEETPVFSFSEENIVDEITSSVPGRNSRYNRVIIRFPNKANNFKMDEVCYPEAGSALYDTWLAEDFNLPQEKTITVETIVYKAEALQLARLMAVVSRNSEFVSFTGDANTIECDVGDVVNLSNLTRGWVNRTFRIAKLVFNEDDTISVEAIQHDNSIYPWVSPTYTNVIGGSNLGDPASIPAPTGLSIVYDETLSNTGTLTWASAPNSFITGFVVTVLNGSTEVFKAETISKAYTIPRLDVGNYSIQVKAKNTIGGFSPVATISFTLAVPVAPSDIAFTSGNFDIEARPVLAGIGLGTTFEYAIGSTATVRGRGLSMVFTSLTPATNYTIYARTINSYGVSAWFSKTAATNYDQTKLDPFLTTITNELNRINTVELVNVGQEVAALEAKFPLTGESIGTGVVTTVHIAVDAITNAQIANLAVNAAKIADNAVSTSKIVAGAVDAGKIAASAVGPTHLANLAVTAGKIAANAVTATEIAANAVTTAKIAASAVTATQLASLAVTTAKIAANAIDVTKIADLAVTTGKIAAGAVDSSKIADASILSAKLADNAVTTAKIAALAIDAGKIANGAIGSTQLADLAITAQKVSDSAITTSKIAPLAIDAGKISLNAVGSAQLADLAVNAAKIAANAVTVNAIADNAVTSSKIIAGAITAGKIAAGSITATQIAAGSIVSTSLAANSITARELLLTDFSNIFPNPDFIAGKTDGWEGVTGAVLTSTLEAPLDAGPTEFSGLKTTGLATQDAYGFSPIPVSAGEQFYFETWAVCSGITATSLALQLRLYNAATPTGSPFTVLSVAAPTTWTKVSGFFTMPNGWDRFKAGLRLNNVTVAGQLYFTGFRLRRMASAELIVDGSVSANKVAANAITADKIQALAVTAGKIAANAVTANEIAAGSIVAGKIAASAITATEISAGAITTAKILAGAVTANELAAGSVTAAKIVAGTITATELAAGSITTSKIATGAITSNEVSAGAITASKVLITGNGEVLNQDPNTQDISAWAGAGISIINDPSSPVGNTVLRCAGLRQTVLSNNIQIDGSRSYEYRLWIKTETGSPTTYLTCAFYDGNNNLLNPATTGWSVGTFHYFALLNAPVPLNWTEYRISFGANEPAAIPANAKFIRIGLLSNYENSGSMLATGIKLYQKKDSDLIVDGSIQASKIAAGAVVASKIAANAITSASISAGAVTAGKIAANAVTATEIAAGAITAGKILAGSITATELSSSSITTAKIAASAITSGTIAAGAVTAGKIAANAVTATEIAAGAITAGKVAANAITATEIAASAVTSAKIAANAVTASQIAAGAVTAGKIAAGVITATEIAAGTITSNNIAAGSISTTRLTVTPASICPDPYFADTTFWQGPSTDGGGWFFYEHPSIQTAFGFSRCVVANPSSTPTGTARKHLWSNKVAAPSIGDTVRLKAIIVNQTNQNVSILARFKSVTGADLWDIQILALANDGSNVPRTASGVVPANASHVEFIIYNEAGTTWTGQVYVSAVTLEVMSSSDLIVNGAIVADKLATNSVVADKIAAGAIIAGKIGANSIAGDEIQANAITAGKIAALNITGDKIAANAITADKIAANSIVASHINAGVITADKLQSNAVQAALVSAGGIDVTNSNYQLKFLTSERPIELRKNGEVVYSVNPDGTGFYKGGLGDNTVSTNAITVEARKAINPFYTGVGEVVSATVPAFVASSTALTLNPMTTILAGNKVSISFRLADSFEQYGGSTYYSSSVYSSKIQRSIGGGAWTDIPNGEKTFTITGFYSPGGAYPEPGVSEGGYYYDVTNAVTDTLPSTSSSVQYRVLITLISAGTNTSGGATFQQLKAEKSGFTANTFANNGSVMKWVDKETGFTVICGTVTVGQDTSATVNYGHTLNAVLSASAQRDFTNYNDWTAGAIAAGTTSATIYNQNVAGSMKWSVMGFTAI